MRALILIIICFISHTSVYSNDDFTELTPIYEQLVTASYKNNPLYDYILVEKTITITKSNKITKLIEDQVRLKKIEILLNTDGQVLSETSSFSRSNYSTKTSYEYDSVGNLIKEEKYNTDGNLETYIDYFYEGELMQYSQEFLYSYGKYGNKTEYKYSPDLGITEKIKYGIGLNSDDKTIAIYQRDKTDRLIRESYLKYNSIRLISTAIYEYEYSNNGQLFRRTVSDVYNVLSYTIYKYGSNDLLVEEIKYGPDGEFSSGYSYKHSGGSTQPTVDKYYMSKHYAYKSKGAIVSVNPTEILKEIEVPTTDCRYDQGKVIPYTERFEDGTIQIKGFNTPSKKLNHGAYKEWYQNGVLRVSGGYECDDRAGKWLGWYENGQKSFAGQYVEDEPDGKWISWHENGQKKIEENFTSFGNYNFEYSEWYSNGILKQTGYYSSGAKLGDWTTFYQNGEVESIGRESDSPNYDRFLSEFHPNGRRKSTVAIIHVVMQMKLSEQPIGLYTEWYPNGNLKTQGFYNEQYKNYNGRVFDGPDGVWTEWDENGRKLVEYTYERFNLIKTKHFSQTELDAEKIKSPYKTPLKQEPTVENGSLNIVCFSEGKSIYIDGELVGTTPIDENFSVKQGTHSISFYPNSLIEYAKRNSIAASSDTGQSTSSHDDLEIMSLKTMTIEERNYKLEQIFKGTKTVTVVSGGEKIVVLTDLIENYQKSKHNNSITSPLAKEKQNRVLLPLAIITAVLLLIMSIAS